MVKELPLTQGKVALIDDEDFERVASFTWCAVKMQKGNGREHWYGKRGINQDGRVINCYLHRFILGLPDAVQVDHEDGDGLNCQKSNMRYASKRQNHWNQKRPANKTGFRGVRETPYGWVAVISHGGRTYNLGTFPAPETAARAFDAGARFFRSEFANTNFPDADPETELTVRQAIEAAWNKRERTAA